MSKNTFQKPEIKLMKSEQIESQSNEDLSAIDKFCADITFEDVSIDEWVNHDNSLNLVLFLRLTQDESQKKGNKELTFSRTVKSKSEGKIQEQRIKTTVDVTWPAGVDENFTTIFLGFGDEIEGRVGNLLVKVKIKNT